MEKRVLNGVFADCYVLADYRSKARVDEFLNHFLPEREESSDGYSIPIHGEAVLFEFNTAEELMKHIEVDINEPASIYWRNLKNENVEFAMAFFTNDDKLILGLSCRTHESDTEIEDAVFSELKEYVKTNEGYIAYECPPPFNSVEFKRNITL